MHLPPSSPGLPCIAVGSLCIVSEDGTSRSIGVARPHRAPQASITGYSASRRPHGHTAKRSAWTSPLTSSSFLLHFNPLNLSTHIQALLLLSSQLRAQNEEGRESRWDEKATSSPNPPNGPGPSPLSRNPPPSTSTAQSPASTSHCVSGPP